MSRGEWMVMLVVTAYQARLVMVVVAALALAGAITLRLAPGRRWYDSVSTFLLLSGALIGVTFLAVHVLMGLPVASVELLTFRD